MERAEREVMSEFNASDVATGVTVQIQPGSLIAELGIVREPQLATTSSTTTGGGFVRIGTTWLHIRVSPLNITPTSMAGKLGVKLR
jgi:hypothetical protein